MLSYIQNSTPSQKRIPVAILGATGVVGQRFLRRIANHPWFYPVYLTGSERSAGKRYSDACQWHLFGEPYAGFGDTMVAPSDPEHAYAPIVFSALDAKAAQEIEPRFAAAGAYVFSNASAFRMEDDVPLLIPEINPEHLGLLEEQRTRRNWKGAIIANPNCTTVMLASALAPLDAAFGIEAVMMTSMQAISGAGYPGVPALDIVGNVIPYISNEEPKVESESNKILGTLFSSSTGRTIVDAPFAVSATCTRVPVIDGHTLSVSVKIRNAATLENAQRAFSAFIPKTEGYVLPSAPKQFLQLSTQADRPQPRLDVDVDNGMRIFIGRLRECPILDLKFVVMGNNIERGAAGASVLNAELALAMGALPASISLGRGKRRNSGENLLARVDIGGNA
jgi:aspartate-semialdehyde dehydrogenase